MLSIRKKQTDALKRMLGCTEEQLGHEDLIMEPEWKVLVYDETGQNILSPVLPVSVLNKLGVTLFLLLDRKRDQIPDTPAVYLVQPTEENVRRICKDIADGLYSRFELNFISPLPRNLLEILATETMEASSVEVVTKVYDMYCDFLSVEDDFFGMPLGKDNVKYYALNDQEARDADIEASMEEIVDALFSVLVTLGVVPIIRCSRRNAAEQVSKLLDQRLREHLRSSRSSLLKGESMSATGSFQRPVLVLLDRNVDVTTVLHHTWTYQALVHDVLDFKLNRVTMPLESGAEPGSRAKTYDISLSDKFWGLQRGKPFPKVAEAVQEELGDVQDREKRIRLQTDSADMSITDGTAALSNAIETLPLLMERKRFLDMHTTLLTTIMDILKDRSLDAFFELEEEIMNKKSLSSPVLEILQDAQSGSPHDKYDKLRLYIVYFMDQDLQDDEMEKCEAALRKSGCDIAALTYLRDLKRMNKLANQPMIAAAHTSESLFSRAAVQSKIGNWVQGIRNLIPTSGDLPVTRIVDELMELKGSKLTKDYLYFDPKLLRGSGTTDVPKGRAPFEEAIVFVIGGGNYTEYQNLVDYCDRENGQKRIVYGVTQVMDAEEFLGQLTELGHKMSADS